MCICATFFSLLLLLMENEIIMEKNRNKKKNVDLNGIPILCSSYDIEHNKMLVAEKREKNSKVCPIEYRNIMQHNYMDNNYCSMVHLVDK